MKKTPQQVSAFLGQYSGGKFHPVIQAGVVQDAEDAAYGAGFGVEGSKYEPRDACMDHGSGAHGAWFERHIERAAFEAIVAERAAGVAHGDDLRVGGWIVIANDPVLAAGEERSAGIENYGADRDFSGSLGQFGFRNSYAQPGFVCQMSRWRCHRLPVYAIAGAGA